MSYFFQLPFCCLHLIILGLAFLTLIPLRRHEFTTNAKCVIVVLHLANFLFYGSTGILNVVTFYVCIIHKQDNLCIEGIYNLERLFTITGLNFSFPVLNSLATAVIISRGNRIKHKIRELLNELHVIGTGREAS